MADDGGPAYPIHGVGTEIATGMSFRERCVVAIVAGWQIADGGWPQGIENEILNRAQALTDEAMKRRKQDNTERLAAGGDEVKHG